MDTDFKDVMLKRTDDELIKIVTVDKNKYQPLAVEAAEEEIKKRNIDTTKIEQVKVDLTAKIEKQDQFEAKKVSSWTRFLNFIIDVIVWFIIVAILTSQLNAKDPVQMLFGYLILFASYVGYYAFMEIRYQKTIGKFITKTKVVDKNGTKPKDGDILRRSFCRLIPFDRISFLFTPNGFHDRLSDTTIIKDVN
ncbi:RDD family protein [Flavobacterium sp. ZT3R17]|uniref:RDD family protein n=1 Tax=Flavobacterium cryoconiti TaxID=3398736 RepID=UPI003A858B34